MTSEFYFQISRVDILPQISKLCPYTSALNFSSNWDIFVTFKILLQPFSNFCLNNIDYKKFMHFFDTSKVFMMIPVIFKENFVPLETFQNFLKQCAPENIWGNILH